MKSSGSNALVATDVFVPEHRVIRVPPALGGDYPTEHLATEPLYRSALVPTLAPARVPGGRRHRRRGRTG